MHSVPQTTSPNRPRSVLYARVSTRMQVQDGLSLDVQIREMEEYAAKKGWDVVGRYIDAGKSGSSLQRPEIQRLLADMVEDRFDIVIAMDSSRLSRDAKDFMYLLDRFQEHGIRPAFLQEPEHDISTPEGRLRAHIMASIHEYQLGVTRTKVIASKHQRARIGLHNASTIPYGYKSTGAPKAPLIIDEQEAEAVRLAFSLYATGHYSFHDVAQELNRRGYRHRPGSRVKSSPNHPERDLTKFTAEGIRDMLGNRFYVGDIVYERMRIRNKKRVRKKDGVKKVYQGQHVPIIDRTLFERVQEVKKQRRSKPKTYSKANRVYLVNGIVECNLCHMPLRAQAAKSGQRYYREISARKNLDCPYHGLGAKAHLIEAQLGIIFSHFHLPEDWQDAIIEEQEALVAEEAPRDFAKERRAIQKRIERLTGDYYDGNFDHLGDKTEHFYRKKLREYQGELEKLPSPSQPFPSQEDEINSVHEIDLQAVWEEATMEEKRALMRDCIEAVDIDPSESRLTGILCDSEFLPIFLQNPLLNQIGDRYFTIRPMTEEDATNLQIETWPTLRRQTAPWIAWPYLHQWGMKPPRNVRSSPELSNELRRLRKAGHSNIQVISLHQPSIPSFMHDRRKWPHVNSQNVTLDAITPDFLSIFPDHSLHVLRTTFPEMQKKSIEQWVQEGARVLHSEGAWLLTTLLIHQMPSHWLHEAFPSFWEHMKSHSIDIWELKEMLQRQGLKIYLKGARKTIFQSISIPTASEILTQLVENEQLSREATDAFLEEMHRKAISEIPSLMVMLNARIVHRS